MLTTGDRQGRRPQIFQSRLMNDMGTSSNDDWPLRSGKALEAEALPEKSVPEGPEGGAPNSPTLSSSPPTRSRHAASRALSLGRAKASPAEYRHRSEMRPTRATSSAGAWLRTAPTPHGEASTATTVSAQGAAKFCQSSGLRASHKSNSLLTEGQITVSVGSRSAMNR